MKKILCLSFVFLLITNLPYKTPVFFALAKIRPHAIYSFYVLEKVNAFEDYYVIDNAGLGDIVRCEVKQAKKVKQNLNNVAGESVQFLGSLESALSILSFYQAVIVKNEWLDGQIYNVYAKSRHFNHSIYMENEFINLQVCFANGVVTVGSPIILGDY